MELKVMCDCGQKYKFEVEPVEHQMPFAVNCPACGVDGTSLANQLLLQTPAGPVAATVATAPAGLRINRHATAPTTVATVAPTVLEAPATTPPARARPGPSYTPGPATPKYMQNNPAIQNNNFLLGTVGAIVGAAVAVGFMVSTRIFFGFSFPMFGTIMGAVIGFGARIGYRGTDSTLGGMAALVAVITIGVTLYMMFGILGILFSLVSVVIGTMAAFKIASG